MTELIRIWIRRMGRELHWDKSHSGQQPGIQRVRKLRTVDPRRSYISKRSVSSTADRNICRLDQAQRGIKNRLPQTTEIRRRIGPREAGVIEPVAPLPAFHFDHTQRCAQFVLSIEITCEFTQRHTMADWYRRDVDIALASSVGKRALHKRAGDRIGTVEDHDLRAAAASSFQKITDHRLIRVEANSRILEIDEHSIQSAQRFHGWPAIGS